MALPVTIVASGGLPVIDMAANGFPVTSVASGGLPVTLVAGYNLGIGVTFVSESGAAVTENITATWDGETNDLTPDFALDSLEFAVNDVVEMRRSASDSSVVTYTAATATITSITPLTLDTAFDFGGDWAAGTWYVQFWLKRSSVEVGKSNIETFTLVSLAPVLSSPVDTTTGETTASGSVSTTGTSGTLYAVITTSSTSPTAAQVKAGQNHLGASAVVAKSQAVSGSGVQTITGGFTGLTASTAYYAHYMHENIAAQQSNVSSADGFTTDAPAALHTYAGHHMRDAGISTTSTHSVDFGSFGSTRTAVLCINFFQTVAGNTVTGVTVDTNGATLVVAHNVGFSKTAMYRIDVTSGGTKSIVVTSSGGMYNIDVVVHILAGVNNTPVGTDKDATGSGTTKVLFSGASGNGTGTQDIPTGGVMILSVASRYNQAMTFPSATTDVDTWSGGSGTIQSASGHHYGSNLNPTVTAAVNTEFAACGAIWGP